ncbi:MAG: tyrosine--tRNA ligase [Candidatus Ranarchaeia archaeon]
MDLKAKMQLCLRGTQEVISKQDLEQVLETKKTPNAYIGFEISGLVHLGTGLIQGGKLLDLHRAGCNIIVLLADWHSWINNKLDGDLEKIQLAGKYYQDAFRSLGISENNPRMKFVWASELVNDSQYWENVIRVAKNTSMKRIMRTLPIMGRVMKQGDLESAWVYYPAMQVADMFYMDIDIAAGGMDQRKAHMLARDVALKLGRKKPVALHTELLTGLSGQQTKMDFDENPDLSLQIASKMSKSLPDTCVFIHDEPSEIRRKLRKAYCPAKQVRGNPVIEIARLILFPLTGQIDIERPEKYGGNKTYCEYVELANDFVTGKLHPSDLKNAVIDGLVQLLEPARKYFASHPESLESIKQIMAL